MSKENNSHIVCILDRSGSMQHLTNETVSGFNDFVKEQRELFPDASLTLVLFNHLYEVVYDRVPLEEVEELTNEAYDASGYTALIYALIKTVKSVKKAQDKEAKTIVLVMTDGQENYSDVYGRKKYNNDKAKSLVEKMTEVGWKFVFIGAGIDAFEEAGKYGFQANDIYNVQASAAGMSSSYKTMRSQTKSYLDQKDNA